MQELNQVRLCDAVGKEIAAVFNDFGVQAIKYTDGSFSFFDYNIKHDDDYMVFYDRLIDELIVFEHGTTMFSFRQNALIAIGVLSADKIIEDGKLRIDNAKKIETEKEYQEYQRLKLKFEYKI